MVLLTCGIQYGKGVPLDAGVLTPTGYRKAGDIKEGDFLIDRNGKPTKAIGVYLQGKMPTYEIGFRDGRSFRCDINHLHILKPRPDRKERVVTTEQIVNSPHYIGKAQIPAISGPVNFKKAEYFIKPYTLGVLLGDGSITKSSEITSVDPEIIAKVKRELPDGMIVYQSKSDKIRYIIKEEKRRTDDNGYCKSRFLDELRRLKLYGKKSQNKHIPDEYLIGSPDQRLALLRGLMDTDGTVKKNKYIEFYSTSKRLADGVQFLVESLGGKAWITDKKTTHLPAYRVVVILKKFNPFFLKRKRDEYFVHENTENRVIHSVRRIEDTETVCFKVDSPTESFIGENMTVTHNTRVGSWRTKMAMHRFTDPEDTFIIAAPTYKTLQQATLPAFLSIMKGLGTYNKADAVFEMHGGGKCFMRTATDPNSVVGITNCRHIWGDEAGLFPLYFHENLQARAAFKQAPICYTSSPYSLNWIYTDYVRPWHKSGGNLPGVELIQARSDENPYFPRTEFERKKATMDPRRFNMMFGGEFHKLEGLVYDCFDEDTHVVDKIPQTAKPFYIAGVDWGYTNPAVILVFAVCPKWGMYLVAEYYESGKTIGDIVKAAEMIRNKYGDIEFHCDPSGPANIAEFGKVGLKAVPADNDIRAGIDAMYEMIASNKFHVLKGTGKNFLDEIAIYHYPNDENVKPDQDVKDRLPVKQHDHACDSSRYISLHLKKTHFNVKKNPTTPGASEQDLRLHYQDKLILAEMEDQYDW